MAGRMVAAVSPDHGSGVGTLAAMAMSPGTPTRQPVPVRTIVATIALVAATYVGYLLVKELARVITWVLIAGFFAVVLGPAVDIFQRRLHLRRAVAATMVFVLGLAAVAGLLYAFIRPVVGQVQDFVDDLPGYVEDAQEGRGTIGELVERYELQDWVEENQDRLQEGLRSAGKPALDAARTVFNTILATITILVLTFLLLMRGPGLCQFSLNLIDDRHTRERVRLVATDAARAISGYMFGNLLISVIAGLATYVFLRILGVPYPEVIALFVAFADLIPLVGATLGAIPTIGLSFLHSTPAGIAAVIFYIVYQQFENHFLQVTIMSRTVQVNPLTVLISVLAGVELFGFLGALLAIPAAGVIQVIVRNLWDERKGGFKEHPTVGSDEIPIISDDLPPALRPEEVGNGE
jgi:predicted PurR-regulated permease PerM